MPTDHELWFRLLQRLCEGAAQHRIQRIYAPLAQRDDDLRELFRQLGFHSYAQQTALRLEGPDWDQGTTLAPMRSQSRRDEWGIHKLYGAVTPRMVQQAEARNPRTWALPLSQRMGGTQRRGWVLGPEDDLTAYLRVMHGSVGHVFSLLIRPEARDLMPDVLRFGLAQILDTRPVYLLLREYQSELLAAAHHLGFHPIGDQALLVKSMVIPFQRTVLMPALEPGLEPNVRISNTG